MNTTQPTAFHSRYQLDQLLGQGSMGSVYRATDHLTGQTVALKQVRVAPDQLTFGSRPVTSDQEAILLALTREFHTLAGLRHPHIISVLDYGIDHQRYPFFTMELLPDAQALLSIGPTLSLIERVSYLLQVLEALAYLHRRGVLHHDLKSEHMLVAHNQLYVLDFGLAVMTTQQRDSDAFGTLQYLAPEVLDGQSYTEASDLYSFGVIAYELLLGQHPFQSENTPTFLERIFTSTPDVNGLRNEYPALAQLLLSLLAPDPALRPRSAQATMTQLRAALQLPEHAEPLPIRESYLQAARFVGRETELALLIQVLDQTIQGHGQGWLIAGESGVGKSRLLEELRIHALVAGYTVLRGQGIAQSGGRPYELWLEPLRQLLVVTPQVSDHSAGVLAQIIPDLSRLIGRPIPEVVELQGEAARQRLFSAMTQLLITHNQPILLILEDLQWAEASLLPLPTLLYQLAHYPILILGSYRSDERPHLPQELPAMQHLLLSRLNDAAVAELSAAMLGEVGRQAEIVAFLQRETEGNTFFALEVVRALADHAGRLQNIAAEQLPATLLPRGIAELVSRRLEKLPARAQLLLQLAAVIGRELDLAVLGSLADGVDITQWWLPICAEASILQTVDNRWRFSHDKIRETLLAHLPLSTQIEQHQRVAAVMTHLYGEQPAYANTLAFHWQQARQPEREYHFRVIDGDYAQSRYLYNEALEAYERAFVISRPDQHVTDLKQSIDLMNKLATNLIERDTVRAYALAVMAQELSQSPVFVPGSYQEGVAESYKNMGLALGTQGYHEQSLALFQEAAQQFTFLGDIRKRAIVLERMGGTYWHLENYDMTERYAIELRALGEELDDQHLVMLSYRSQAMACEKLKKPEEELHYEQEALQIARAIHDRYIEAIILSNHCVTLVHQGRTEEALSYALEGLKVSREIGSTHSIVHSGLNVASLYLDLGHYDLAWQYYNEIHQLAHTLHLISFEADIELLAGDILLAQGQASTSLNHFLAAESKMQDLNLIHIRADLYKSFESAYTALGDQEKVAEYQHKLQLMSEH